MADNKLLIKICGITRLEDALLASELGAWAVGFIFVKTSARYIEPEKAAEIIKSLPENLEKTGVFANCPIEEIANIANMAKLTQIQLHGDETEEFCKILKEKVGVPLIKAVRIEDFKSLKIITQYQNSVSAILLDSYSSEELGGTGKSFNPEIALEAKKYGMPIILAGGINTNNLKQVYFKVKPYAVDVSSGVETSKGIKDHQKLNELFSVLNS